MLTAACGWVQGKVLKAPEPEEEGGNEEEGGEGG